MKNLSFFRELVAFKCAIYTTWAALRGATLGLLILASLFVGLPAQAQTFVNTAIVRDSITQASPTTRIRSSDRDTSTRPRVIPESSNSETAAGTGEPQALIEEPRNDPADQVGAWTAYLGYARRHPEAFRRAAAELDTLPQRALARVSADAPDSAYVAAYLARIAADPLESEIALREVGGSAPVRVAQDELRYRLADARERRSGWPVILFATGTVRESLGTAESAKDDGKQPLGTGALGASMRTGFGLVTANVNIVSSENVVEGNFGPTVLSPGAGASLSAALLDFRLRGTRQIPTSGNEDRRGFRIPVPTPNHLYLTAASSRWRAGTDTTAAAVHTTVLGAGALWERALVEASLSETEIALRVEGGFSGRLVGGDAFRNGFINAAMDGARVVGGLEGGFSLTFGRVTAATQLYLYGGEGGAKVDRLTGLQMVAGLSVSGEFLRGRVPSR
jgi:hypothetical protein